MVPVGSIRKENTSRSQQPRMLKMRQRWQKEDRVQTRCPGIMSFQSGSVNADRPRGNRVIAQ